MACYGATFTSVTLHVDYLLQVPYILSYIPQFLTQPAALQFSNRNFLYSFVNSHIHVTRSFQLITTLRSFFPCSCWFFSEACFYVGFTAIFLVPRSTEKSPVV
jgi:hypothetical protein